jgi:hypothetical protein
MLKLNQYNTLCLQHALCQYVSYRLEIKRPTQNLQFLVATFYQAIYYLLWCLDVWFVVEQSRENKITHVQFLNICWILLAKIKSQHHCVLENITKVIFVIRACSFHIFKLAFFHFFIEAFKIWKLCTSFNHQ